ncbi:cyclin-dependent kinase 4 inhibitor C [Brachyhypopomus gauderio]|uniref:cyclin-dependent kinase 4 inhibitor C n=1 Tax=Brachyhypopomus gauderio TaxID=698409 RepID=UPI0040411B2F
MAGAPDANGLCNAAARGDRREIEMILQSNIDVNEKNVHGRTALQVVKLGCPSVAEILLRAKADPNMRDPIGGLTITHDAARDGYVDMLQVLVNYGADVNLLDNGGNLPLHLAAGEGHLDAVQFLIQHTTHPFHKNQAGLTPIDLASVHKKNTTAHWLVTYSHVNSQSNY